MTLAQPYKVKKNICRGCGKFVNTTLQESDPFKSSIVIPTHILDALAVGSSLSIEQKQRLKQDIFRNYPKDYAALVAWFCPKCRYKNYEAYARVDCPNKLCHYCRHESPKELTKCLNCGAPL